MKRSRWTLFLVVFALALVVRVANLDSFPPGLWMDEGLNGVDAWYSLHGDARRAADLRMVYPDIFPREPLLVWILSVALAIGGPKVIVMRLTTVLIGSLACVALFGMVAATDRRRGLGLALTAAFVLATLHWHAHFSRLVFRTNLMPLLACAAVWAIASASRNGHRPRWRWLLAGAVVGVGFHAYLAWYFFLPVIALWLWALAAREGTTPEPDTDPRASILRSLPVFALGAGLIAAPLFFHYLTAPSDLTGRAEAVSPLKNGLADGARLITANVRDVLLMFSFRGDHVPLHNVATGLPSGHPDYGKTGTPVLDIVWSLFFVAGVLRALLGLRGAERRRCAAWLGWLVCMSLPSILSQTDSANTLRNLGATPAVAYCIASGWWWAFETATARTAGGRRRIARAVLISLLIWGAGFQVHKSWVRHPKQPGIQSAFSALHVELARMCSPDPAGALLYVPTDFYGHKTFEFLTIGREDIRPLDFAEALARPTTGPAANHRIVCTALSPGNSKALRQAFPGAEIEPGPIRLYPPGGGQPRPYAWIVRIPSGALLPRAEAEKKAQALRLVRER
jgi:hypothetical protein